MTMKNWGGGPSRCPWDPLSWIVWPAIVPKIMPCLTHLLAQEGREGFTAAYLRHRGWEEDATCGGNLVDAVRTLLMVTAA